MDWRDEGIVLAVRGHGESSAIIEVLTRAHGRHAGVVRGATSRRTAPVLLPGNQVAVAWRARLADHIGTLTVEPVRARAAAAMADPAALAGLRSVCALAAFALAERDPCPVLHDRTAALLDRICAQDTRGGNGPPAWALAYLHWEADLLADTGFGLDLTRCAVTGARDGLAYVSPRTGRAVSRAGAGDWAARLLPLPACLLGADPHAPVDLPSVDPPPVAPPPPDLVVGLRVTGHFLAHHLAPALGDRPLPAARAYLLDLLARGF